MRIAIATDWFAPRRGGIELQIAQLAARLAARGHDVDVLTSTPGSTDDQGYRVKRLETPLLPVVHLAVSPTLIGSLRGELLTAYDVVHAHVSVMSPVGYAAAAIARSLGLPTVVTFHSVLLQKRHLLSLVNAMSGGGLSGSPVVWTGVSELVASQVREALHDTDVSVLPNGIDVAFWRGAGAGRARNSTAVLVSTMRLHRKKRARELVAAFAAATQHASSPATLRMLGDGPERAAIERDIRRLGLSNGRGRVELLGWLAPEQIRCQYESADGFVLASRRESFGIAALEAAVAGLRVIAMADAGCREFLDGGAHALCRDDGHLEHVIARFIDDALPREIATQNSLERYDWSFVLEQHELAYQRARARATVARAAEA